MDAATPGWLQLTFPGHGNWCCSAPCQGTDSPALNWASFQFTHCAPVSGALVTLLLTQLAHQRWQQRSHPLGRQCLRALGFQVWNCVRHSARCLPRGRRWHLQGLAANQLESCLHSAQTFLGQQNSESVHFAVFALCSSDGAVLAAP